MSNYFQQKDGTWKCKHCGKIVREHGWSGHSAWHRRKYRDSGEQMHIDTYPRKEKQQ
ncbi:MAG: hypothetical protein ACE5H1_00280 [Thermodesulfobacteriota bacterium]